MADIPLVQEAPEQEKKGNEGLLIKIIRTDLVDLAIEVVGN